MLLLFVACDLSTLPAFSQTGKIGVQAVGGTLGIGGQVAVQVLKRANVRGGFSAYNFSHTFNQDGINYNGTLNLGAAALNFDWYLLGPLHVSPGLLLYNRFHGGATASVAAGQTFTLGSATYQSGAANPLNGTLTLSPNKVAPELLIGFGNLVPRSGRHFTVNFDLGAVFQGSPAAALALTGLACVPPNNSGPTCETPPPKITMDGSKATRKLATAIPRYSPARR